MDIAQQYAAEWTQIEIANWNKLNDSNLIK